VTPGLISSGCDVESLERATLAAVPPEHTESLGQWLLAMDRGTVGRAKCAVPLRHDAPPPGELNAIEQRYAAAGFKASFRLPNIPAFADAHASLTAMGYLITQPTAVMSMPTEALATSAGRIVEGLQQSPDLVIRADERPDADWQALFLGEGFDPVDGASRVQILARAKDALYMSVRSGNEVLACGMAGLSQEWLGIHGMRTAKPARGKGLATVLISAMAGKALERGIARSFLQVDQSNTGARRLYDRLGFAEVWEYAYWRPSVVPTEGSLAA